MLHISAFEINDQEVEAAVPFEATPCTAESEIAGKEFGQGVAQKAKCLQSETCEMTVNVVTEGCGSRRKREAGSKRMIVHISFHIGYDKINLYDESGNFIENIGIELEIALPQLQALFQCHIISC